MPPHTLNALLRGLDIAEAPRYSLDDVSTLLGLTHLQIQELLKKRRLRGFKGSSRCWTGVLHADLDSYVSAVNGGAR